MATHKTLTGRARNSTIPQATVEKRSDLYLAELQKAASDTVRRMGAETEQVDVRIEDELTYLGILRDIQTQGLTVELKLAGDKPERVTVEVRSGNTFRITRPKKTPPPLPARSFGNIPPPKKR